jgi:hypothetical protein
MQNAGSPIGMGVARVYDGVMIAQGHPLIAVDGFPSDLVSRLRDELSVSTAEEFVDVSTRQRPLIARLLNVSESRLDDLSSRAASVVDAAELNEILHPAPRDYSYATGLDAPAEGDTFYRGESSDD